MCFNMSFETRYNNLRPLYQLLFPSEENKLSEPRSGEGKELTVHQEDKVLNHAFQH